MKLSDIKKIGVAGGGTMGFGIAFNFAFWGYPTVVYDLNDQILEESAQLKPSFFCSLRSSSRSLSLF
jgi:3-hydroxyacyl-CoA dehydrogenase